MSESLATAIDRRARRTPAGVAFIESERHFTWADYADRSERLAGTLIRAGLEPGERVAVLLPDGPGVHAAFVGAEKAGLITVGIGPRSGLREIRHLLQVTGASALISRARYRDTDMADLVAKLAAEGLPLRQHVAVQGELDSTEPALAAPTPELHALLEERRLGPDALFVLNATSGTTGMPKCVTHDQRRWFYFHELAVEAGELRGSDVFLSAIPAPFGFGIWTSHVTPALLGAPTVVMAHFTADEMIRCIERHRVTVLAAVSTQFIMMLNSPALEKHDVSSLRALFTGGEAVPYERAAEFEERTGALVLQFFGSNETGALSRTTSRDTREIRLGTAGHVIEGMNVRLFDEHGNDVTSTGVGQPGCRGPATSRGYYNDEEANAGLYTRDGWMLTGDMATLDERGVLRVIGRSGDFIIRGGKNISGPAVEAAVSRHPAVAVAAAVAMPDPVYGERVCVYAELRPDHSLSLEELAHHLERDDVSKEMWPERLIVVDQLPRSAGGKVAKHELRDDIRRRLQEERERRST
jgi:acyl-CoA synthetase